MQNLKDDIYVVLYFDDQENELAQVVCESLEELAQYQKAFKIISWANITGKDMQISEWHTNSLTIEDIRISCEEED